MKSWKKPYLDVVNVLGDRVDAQLFRRQHNTTRALPARLSDPPAADLVHVASALAAFVAQIAAATQTVRAAFRSTNPVKQEQ